MKRYLVTIDTAKTDIQKVASEIKKMKEVQIDSVLELIGTIIIVADDNKPAQLKKKITGILSIEEEGSVTTQQ